MVKIKKRIAAILIFVIVLTGAFSINLGQAAAATKGTIEAVVEHAKSHKDQSFAKVSTCRSGTRVTISGDWCAQYIYHCVSAAGFDAKKTLGETTTYACEMPAMIIKAGGKVTFLNEDVKNAAFYHSDKTHKSEHTHNHKDLAAKIDNYEVVDDNRTAFSPQVGDLVFFDSESYYNDVINHVEMVVLVNKAKKTIVTAGGNSGGGAGIAKYGGKKATYNYCTDRNIIAFARPNYNTKSFTAAFNSGASDVWGNMPSITIGVGNSTPLSENQYIRNGYTFAGWTAKKNDDTWMYTNGNGTSGWYKQGKQPNGWKKYVYQDKQKITYNSASLDKCTVTYYAQWKKTDASCFYYSSEGKIGAATPQCVQRGQKFYITNTVPSRTGYTFKGWNVYRIKDKKYYVTGKGWLSESEINSNGYTKTLYTKDREYGFTGSWWKGCSAASHYIMIAKWEKNPVTTFTVKYMANGGSGSMANTTVTYGEATTLKNNQFKKEGCSFVGWTAKRDNNTWRYISPDGSAEKWCAEGSQPSGWKKYVYKNQAKILKTYSKNKGVVYFYAQWKQNEPQTFTIKYNANGGSGSMADTVVTYGKATPLRNNQFVKQGYKFVGWTAKRDDNTWRYYQPNGSGDGWYAEGRQPSGWKKFVYANQVNVLHTYNKNKGVVTFYAQWEQSTAYTLYYNANGGNVSPSAMEVTEGARFSITRVVPEKEGYTFAGWTVLRLSDNKSYVTGRGWFTEEEIEDQGYTKRVYTPGELYTFDAAWTTGYAGTSDYLFIAQWEKEESTDPIEEPNPPFIEPEPPVVDPEPPITEPEQPDNESKVIGFVSEEEYNANYAGNSAYTATPYYRYATRQKEYTESTASSMAGWTQYNQVTTPASSTWSKTKPSGAYETGYQYYCWGWEHNGDWTFYYDDNYNEAVAWIKKNYSVWNYNQFRYFWQVYSTNKGSSVKITQNVNYRDNNGKTGTKYITDTKLWYEGQVYRAKASTKYQYWRWGSWSSWSGWSTQKQSTGDTVKEERQYYVVKR